MKSEQKQTVTIDEVKAQLSDSSKKLAFLTAQITIDNPSLIEPLLEVSWNSTEPWCQRASRVVCICSCRYPEMIRPYISLIISRLEKQHSEGARRNFLKIFLEVPLKLAQKDKLTLLDACFTFLAGSYSVGVKAYSMDILYRLSLGFPEIQRELYAVIEDQIEDSSAGFKSRGNRILQKLSKFPAC
jgi:hypothetical protein